MEYCFCFNYAAVDAVFAETMSRGGTAVMATMTEPWGSVPVIDERQTDCAVGTKPNILIFFTAIP